MKFDTEVKVLPVKRLFENTFMCHERSKATIVAAYAMDLARSGMHFGHEDSKKKLHLFSPQQIAQRACAIAEALFSEMDARGWMKELPAISELEGEDTNKVGF